MSEELPVSKCPVCGYKTNRATGVDHEHKVPTEGDFSLCLKCGEIAVFGADLVLREPTLTEMVALNKDKEASHLLSKAQGLIRKRRPLG